MQDARGNSWSYAYDQYGNRTGVTDPLPRTTTSLFDNLGRMSSQTDPRGNATQYGYDALGRRTSVTDPYNKITSYVFDANGNKTGETNARGFTTTYTFDAVNRMTGASYPDTTSTSFTYDFRGNKLTATDQLGRVTKSVYDLAGQLTNMTVTFGTADAATISYTYDSAGRKTTQTDARNNVTTWTYDDEGRVTSVLDPAGNPTQYVLDAKGQVTSMTDAKHRQTTYSYDSRGRQLTTTTPDAKTVTKTYDGLGVVTSIKDEEDRVTQYTFDAASQLKSVLDSLSQLTQYGYDLSGNKVSQLDARNSSTTPTTYLYDKLNRRTQRTLPLGQFETMAYDEVGNLITRTDFNSKVTSYQYDSMDRLKTKTPDAAFSAAAINYTYTNAGQRAMMTDATGSTIYTYDNLDRVKTKVTPQGTLTYSHDATGNVTSVSSSNANGTNIAYTWDANNRLKTVVDNLTGGTSTYGYDATNQIASIAYPNGVGHGYLYDNRDRLTSLGVNGPSGVLASYTQTFSYTGRKQSIAEASGRTTNFNYDPIYRLMNESIAGNAVAAQNGVLGYTLDPVGNRQLLNSTLAALPSQSNTFDADDRLAADTYDSNGNTLTASGHSFNYEFEDRLTQFDNGAVQFIYDGDGNRVARTEAGTTTRYLIDDLTPTGYAQVAEEVVAGAVVRQYTHGVMRISQRQLIGGTWQLSYYGYDGGGSVRQLFDSTGAVTDSYAYDAFGNTVAQTGTTPNQYLYRGEAFDASTALYYLRARWYRPQVGRFLTQDTYEGEDEDPPSLHRYLYASADPAGRVDPSGFADLVETAEADSFGNVAGQRALSPTNGRIASRTFGQVKKGAETANDLACCLDKTLSVLDLAAQAAGVPHNPALDVIDQVCQLGCKNGETQRTKFGKGQHKNYNPYPGVPQGPGTWQLEVTIPGAGRADAVNWITNEIRELKPNNPRQIAKGLKQLACYKKGMQKWKGGSWTTRLDTY